jgi:hypothetical protein
MKQVTAKHRDALIRSARRTFTETLQGFEIEYFLVTCPITLNWVALVPSVGEPDCATLSLVGGDQNLGKVRNSVRDWMDEVTP